MIVLRSSRSASDISRPNSPLLNGPHDGKTTETKQRILLFTFIDCYALLASCPCHEQTEKRKKKTSTNTKREIEESRMKNK